MWNDNKHIEIEFTKWMPRRTIWQRNHWFGYLFSALASHFWSWLRWKALVIVISKNKNGLQKKMQKYSKIILKAFKKFWSENCDNYFESLASAIFPISSYISVNISGYYNLESYSESSPKLAISYLIHSNPGLFEILFHLMFRPQNSYCIAIDLKSSEEDQNCFHSVIKCYQEKFPNTKIFIIQDDPIYYKGYSILDADLNCLEILYNASR